MSRLACASALAAVLLASLPALAQSTEITYQCEVRAAGAPVTQQHDLTFRVYDALTGGTQIGPTLCIDNAVPEQGRFNVTLDFGAIYDGRIKYLEIEIRENAGNDCTSATGWVLLTPRQQITAAPLSTFAISAASSLSANVAGLALESQQLNGQPASFYQNASSLTTGTLPSARLTGTYASPMFLSSPSNFFNGSGAGLTQLHANNISTGTLSTARLPIPLNLTSAAANAAVINGVNTALSSDSVGVRGEANTSLSGGTGVLGVVTGTGGFGVRGEAEGGYGGYFLAEGPGDTGVYASGGFNGGVFVADNSGGRGIAAFNNATSGSTAYGVYGVTASTTGRGVMGVGDSESGANVGVEGLTSSTTGRGVLGRAFNAGAGISYGVYGSTSSSSATAYGVYASGPLGASGTKSFRIDHPDDPANKYLLHYAAESPEVINFYSETATLDERGEATVELPAYFAKINTKPRYQLTPIGAPMPMLHVAVEIDAAALAAGAKAGPSDPAPVCSFRIAGGAPGGRVSWRVEAVRNDLWMRIRGAPVEVQKEGPELNTYQHPEFYGQPPERSMNYEALPK